jgi:serine/threonine protein kinase
MSRLHTCPQGHSWEEPIGSAAEPDKSVSCPICTASYADPPPPRAALSAAKDLQDRIRRRGDEAESTDASETPTAVLPEDASLGGEGDAKDWPKIPGYEILGVLGRGGMGLVFKARHRELKRLVALKMILAGEHADTQELARFRREAEAVAQLEHPNIVQIYEVGEHQGRPFFSLEFVEGGSLAQALTKMPFAPRQTAQVAEILAMAIHYAHQRGIVHRDLKPGNVLLRKLTTESTEITEHAERAPPPFASASSSVANRFIPKITDFGLAKRLGEDSGDTRTGVIMGTPSYMAPEQAEGKSRDAGPLVDVYALGAILYEMVTGRPPFKASSTLGTLEQVRSHDPVPPGRLQSAVPRDLETICLKCLHKDPARRYASALDLAEDLHRFLAGEPIRARPAGLWERTLKWTRRRPAAAALVVVSIAAVATLLGGIVWHNAQLRGALAIAEDRRREAEDERGRAELNFQKARDAVDEMLTDVGEQKLARIPQMEPVRRALLEKALKFYQGFLQEKSDDPAVVRETGRAYGRRGVIYQMLGQHPQAEDSLKQGLALQEELVARFPKEIAYRQDVAASYDALGNLYRLSSRPTDAEKVHQQALDIRESVGHEDPENLEYQSDIAKSCLNLAVIYAVTGRMDKAEKGFVQALEIHQKLVQRRPDDAPYQEELAKAHTNLGSLYALTGKSPQGIKSYQQSLAGFEKLVHAHPDSPTYRNELAATYNNLGYLYNSVKQQVNAASAQQQAIHIREKLTHDFPKLLDFAVDLGGSYCNMGDAVRDEGRFPAALSWYDKAIRTFDSVLQETKDHAVAKEYLGNALRGRAETRRRESHFADAIPDLERLLPLVNGPERGKAQVMLADCLIRTGDPARAMRECEPVEKTAADSQTLESLARVYAVAPVAVVKDDRLSAAERDKLAERYEAHAVTLLRKSLSAGKGKKQSFAGLERDADFASLRGRADFQKLAKEFAAAK